MSEEQLKHWVINQNELAALQEFIGSLALPWKQTNPYMQLLGNLRPVNYQSPTPVPPDAPTPSEQVPAPMNAKKSTNSRKKLAAK